MEVLHICNLLAKTSQTETSIEKEKQEYYDDLFNVT